MEKIYFHKKYGFGVLIQQPCVPVRLCAVVAYPIRRFDGLTFLGLAGDLRSYFVS